MAEENRFESRLARRGGRIIDVESSISQDPAISPQDGEGAPYTPVNQLPPGEDTAPYMPIAPIPPGQPPAPDQYESWPPAMISLAEGAPVNAIAGRPIHEFTGIQPGNINPIGPAAPSTPDVTIGFDSAFKNAVNAKLGWQEIHGGSHPSSSFGTAPYFDKEGKSLIRREYLARQESPQPTRPRQVESAELESDIGGKMSEPSFHFEQTRAGRSNQPSTEFTGPITQDTRLKVPCPRKPAEGDLEWLLRCEGVQADPPLRIREQMPISPFDGPKQPNPTQIRPQYDAPAPEFGHPPELPPPCRCSLVCVNFDTMRDDCSMKLWCEAVGPRHTTFHHTPLVAIMHLEGNNQLVDWFIRSDSEFFTIQQVSARGPKQPIGPNSSRLSGEAPCNSWLAFKLVPTQIAEQRLRDGNMAPMEGTILATAGASVCAIRRVTITPQPCDPIKLRALAERFNSLAPQVVPVIMERSIAMAPDPSGITPPLSITITAKLTVNVGALFACPDCCCEYFNLALIEIEIVSQYLSDSPGSSDAAVSETARLREILEDVSTMKGLTDLLKADYPKCYISKHCPQPPAIVKEFTLGPYVYSDAWVREIVGMPPFTRGGDGLCAYAQRPAYVKQLEYLPSPNDLVSPQGSGKIDDWFYFFPNENEIEHHGYPPERLRDELAAFLRVRAPHLVADLPVLLSHALVITTITRIRFDVFEFAIPDEAGGPDRSCWCAVPVSLRFSLRFDAFYAAGTSTDGIAWTEFPVIRQEWAKYYQTWTNRDFRRALALPYAAPQVACFATKAGAQDYVDHYSPGSKRDSDGAFLLEQVQCISGPTHDNIFIFFDGANRAFTDDWIAARLYKTASRSPYSTRYFESGYYGEFAFDKNDAFDLLTNAYNSIVSLFKARTNWMFADDQAQVVLPLFPRVHIFGFSRGGWLALALARLLALKRVTANYLAKVQPTKKGEPFEIWGTIAGKRVTALVEAINVNNLVLVDPVRRASGVRLDEDEIPFNVEHMYYLARNTASDDTRDMVTDWMHLFDGVSYNTDKIVGPPDAIQNWSGINKANITSEVINLPYGRGPSEGYNDPPTYVCNHCYMGDAKAVEAKVLAHLRARGVPL